MKKIPYNHISVLLMPTDYCNMNCVYCFNSRRVNQKSKIMSKETLKKIFESVIPYYDEIRFIWHGGEPVSMGMDFYKYAVELQKEVNTKGALIENSIQSNLTLLDDELISFFIENKFKIGGSFDGTQNEKTRHNTERILSGRKKVVEAGGSVGFICVVQSENIDNLIEDYEWFKQNGINYTLNQYMSDSHQSHDKLSVEPEYFAKKICELFDYWLYDTKCNIRISYFNDFVNFVLFKKKSLCCYNSCLGKHIGIQYDGTIFNCNRDFPEEYSYGNIYDYSDIHECFESEGFDNLVRAAVLRRDYCKENCPIFDFCSGGCNSVALMGGDISKSNEQVCKSLILIYQHIERTLKICIAEGKEYCDKLNPHVSKSILNYLDK